MSPHFHGAYDDKPQGGYDFRLFARLVRYMRPYWKHLAAALLLMGFSSLADVAVPWVVKGAVDRYVVARWAIVSPNAPEELLSRALREDTLFVVNLAEVPRAVREQSERAGFVSKERLVPVEPEIASKLPHIQVAGQAFVSESVLKKHPELVGKARARDLRGVTLAGLLVLGIMLLNLLFNYGQVYLLVYASQRGLADLRREVFAKFLRSPITLFIKNPIGRLTTRATNDIAAINEFFSSVLVYLVKDVILIAAILFLMFKMSPGLTWLVLLFVPPLLVASWLFQHFARRAYRAVRRWVAQVNAELQETIEGIKIIQAFVQEARMLKRFKETSFNLFRAYMRQIKIFGVFMPLVNLFYGLAGALLLWYGGVNIIAGAFTFGALMAFMSYIDMFFRPIMDLADKYNIAQAAFAAAERIFGILDGPDEPTGTERLPELKGRVEFKGVWFAYEDEEWVLKDFNLVVEPGQTVAIVGPTGAGKTTIINLLFRFWDPQRGQVLIDGVDIRRLDLRWLRSQMALVQQDVFVFSGTVEDNVRLRESLPRERVERAAEAVELTRFVSLDRPVGERGGTYSSGERQLMAFARALVFDPKILVLDEATAHVDQETEHVIQRSIKKLLEGRTAIVIAHRLATVRDADKIVVVQDGRVVEEGTHEELLAKKGFYYHLYHLQFQRV